MADLTAKNTMPSAKESQVNVGELNSARDAPTEVSEVVKKLILATEMPGNMSEADTEALVAAKAELQQRMSDAKETFRRQVGQIGRKVTGFLDLSAEMRNNIYGHALVFPDAECVFDILAGSHFKNYRMQLEGEFRPGVRILGTCKQIHEEGTPVLYGANKFRSLCQNKDAAHVFAKQIGRNIPHIREMHLQTFGFQLRPALRAFERAITLKKVTVRLSILWMSEATDFAKVELETITATKVFVNSQYSRRREAGREKDKAMRMSTTKNPSIGRREACKLSDREQAIATLEMLHIECPPFQDRYNGQDAQEQKRYEERSDACISAIYDRLAQYIGLIGRRETLEGTGAWDWRAGREQV